MTCEKLRAHRQLVRCKTQRLPRDRFRHTVQFKQNVARSHRRDPVLGLAFALAHARFRWTRRYGFVRENADPQLAFAFHIACERYTSGLQLRVRDPRTFECLQSKLAKVDPEIARSGSLAAAPLGFSILHAFWHQRHKNFSLDCSRLWCRSWRWWRRRSGLGHRLLLLTDPTFHSDFSVNGIGFGKPVIDRRSQRVQRNFAFPIPFRARNL